MTNGNESAFSRPASDRSHHATAIDETNGLTKREYFAAMAMQGLLSDSALCTDTELTETAVEFADCLIDALNKEEAKNEVAELREALEHYAEPMHWICCQPSYLHNCSEDKCWMTQYEGDGQGWDVAKAVLDKYSITQHGNVEPKSKE